MKQHANKLGHRAFDKKYENSSPSGVPITSNSKYDTSDVLSTVSIPLSVTNIFAMRAILSNVQVVVSVRILMFWNDSKNDPPLTTM